MLKHLTLLSILLSFTACANEPNDGTDLSQNIDTPYCGAEGAEGPLGCIPDPMANIAYLIIGDFYGMCSGPGCVDYFKLSNEGAWEDTLDQYPFGNGPSATSFDVAIVDPSYSLVTLADQLNAFSDEFATGSVVGIPDGGDWGGFYLEIQFLDGSSWHGQLDKLVDNVPAEWHNLIVELEATIAALDQEAS